MLKRLLSFVLVAALSVGVISTTAFAAEPSLYSDVTIVQDTSDSRVAVSGDVTATFDKKTNTMYINDGGDIYSFSLSVSDSSSTAVPYANKVVKEESVALHAYEYVLTDSGDYYWGVDIPSYNINPNNWCGWISVWDDGSTEGNFAAEFADYIDAAQDDEHTIATYGGATAVAVIVGLVTKNPTWSASAFKAACAAAGVLVSVGILDAGASYYNNLNNARENYFAIREIVG